MPPKQKITREEILKAAYELALEEGYSSLSSRNVAHAAGCSVQPVFTHFPTMDALRQEIYRYACNQCASEVLSKECGQNLPSVLTLWMLDLARNRPNLFELLYLSDLSSPRTFSNQLIKSSNHRKMVEIIQNAYQISQEDSEDLLIRSCIFLMGIGTIICIDKIDISEETALKLMNGTVSDFINGVKQKNSISK